MIYINKKLYECHGEMHVINKQHGDGSTLFTPVKRLPLRISIKSGRSFWDEKSRYRRIKF